MKVNVDYEEILKCIVKQEIKAINELHRNDNNHTEYIVTPLDIELMVDKLRDKIQESVESLLHENTGLCGGCARSFSRSHDHSESKCWENTKAELDREKDSGSV